MADDSNHIQEEFKFHPCDTPRGMLYYKLPELTDEQQIKLNGHKINIIRQNQIYLSEHPEVRAIISIILRAILRARPKVTLQEFLSKYFAKAWPDIKIEIDRVISEKTAKAVLVKSGPSGTSIMRELRELECLEEEQHETVVAKEDDSFIRKQQENTMCRSILNEIINEMQSDFTMSTDDWTSDAKDNPYPSEITLYDQSKDGDEYVGE